MIKKLMICLIFFSCFSCDSPRIEVEFVSPNDYFIDNVSSETLFYYTFLDSDRVVIPSGEITLIQESLPQGRISITGEEYFNENAEELGQNIFLFRDSSGIELPALQLNLGDFTWEERIIDSDNQTITSEHYLEVTDEMLE